MTTSLDAKFLFSLVDLTTLSGTETDADLKALADNATYQGTQVAALCVYPQFLVSIQRFALTGMPLAAVTNFPEGGRDMDQADDDTRNAVSLGATEIDYVLPYRALMKGEDRFVTEALLRQKAACRDAHLKVIIESGVLENPALIAKASELSIDAGADFIKTSTGKVEVNATLAAAKTMIDVIKASGRSVGFKAAGGIKTADEATAYVTLANGIMGEGWATPETFRIGASSLIADLKPHL